jgi:hypothetical protein
VAIAAAVPRDSDFPLFLVCYSAMAQARSSRFQPRCKAANLLSQIAVVNREQTAKINICNYAMYILQ